jgi:hypothetical protein
MFDEVVVAARRAIELVREAFKPVPPLVAARVAARLEGGGEGLHVFVSDKLGAVSLSDAPRLFPAATPQDGEPGQEAPTHPSQDADPPAPATDTSRAKRRRS